jgi:hypothetical protein
MTINYGRDLSCTDSIKTGRFASGLRLVGEALYRRLITRKGYCPGAPDYGLRVADYLGTDTTPGDIIKLQGLIKQELRKDERIDSVDVTVTETEGDGTERTWTIQVNVWTGLGPFRLVLAVSSVTTELLEIA